MQDDTEQMNKIRNLSEGNLFFRGMIFFFLPIIAFGILSMFYPYVYAMMPVHESELCICSFYHQVYEYRQSGGEVGRKYLFLDGDDYSVLDTTNNMAFYIVNWLALGAIVGMVFAIRHVNDETLIKRECVYLSAIWVVFSLIQFSMFFWSCSIVCW